jgi:hypothetical protein
LTFEFDMGEEIVGNTCLLVGRNADATFYGEAFND